MAIFSLPPFGVVRFGLYGIVTSFVSIIPIATSLTCSVSQSVIWKSDAQIERMVENGLPSSYAYFTRGCSRENSGDFNGALSDYDRAITFIPGDERMLINRGLLRARLADTDGAIADLNKVIASGKPKLADFGYRDRADIKFEMGDKLGALDDYNKAIAITPKSFSFKSGRALVRMSLGDYKGAAEDIDQSITDSKGYDLHAYSAKVLLVLKQKGTKQATDEYFCARESELGRITPKINFDYQLRHDLKLLGGSDILCADLAKVLHSNPQTLR